MKLRLLPASLLLFSLSCVERSLVVESIPSPAPVGAAQPFLFGAGEDLWMSWLEPAGEGERAALRISRLRDGSWSEPATVVERDDLFVNWADFPSVTADANGVLYAHWLQKSGRDTYSYDVHLSISRDGGASWSAPMLLHRDGTQTEHGFVSIAPLPAGGIAATWLDGRNMSGEGHDAHEDGGDMTLRYATVDANGRVAGEVELDPRVCECCTTGMTVTPGGAIVVYRDRSTEEVRDISVVREEGREWSAPVTLHRDGWTIQACPVNGPQIDSIGDRVAVAWFSAAENVPRVQTAFSDGSGRFSPPVAVDEGKPAGRVDIVMLDGDSALVTWLEQTTAGAEIQARVVREQTAGPPVKIADSDVARGSGFPRIARAGADIYFAWTEYRPDSRRIHLARGTF